MRQIINFNEAWHFTKRADSPPAAIEEDMERISLPHTWNALDGQDGGNDYYRGLCYYVKAFSLSSLPKSESVFLEINGASASAEVFLNGEKLIRHDGGYSTFRVDLKGALKEENLLVVGVDNGENDFVYPQNADFTFYGGLYRDVNLIFTEKEHFSLAALDGEGIFVTPQQSGESWDISIKVCVCNDSGTPVRYTVTEGEGRTVFEKTTAEREISFRIENARLWRGKKDPHLYTVKAELLSGDSVSTRFGCRSIEISPERGFLLNGEEYPLRGVSRHQDRKGIGNALSRAHHEEDISLILEMGANAVRLAHYQHDRYFYDLCDEKGLVVWAEIPYISRYMPRGEENAEEQMRELIGQNYNHPCIAVWGISNEITMGGEPSKELLAHHKKMNDLVHALDKTRLTTIACLSNLKTSSPLVHIPDTAAYNHYFGWYGGDVSEYGAWFDEFHEKYPNRPIACSEYGCEALGWHSSFPEAGDYTEEYQAYYHERAILQLFPRKYLWATFVWNMFDFGADARAEGGENGLNHKGLVTFDRSYKKDSFYAYQAWLSDEPFVHLCGKRYVYRAEEKASITVYSNLPAVELYVNGVLFERQEREDHFFRFEVPNEGESVLTARAGEISDESKIVKVDSFHEEYRLKEKGAVLNWFDVTAPEGRYSLHDTLGDALSTFRGKAAILLCVMSILRHSRKGKKKQKGESGTPVNGKMMKMLEGVSLLRLTAMMGAHGYEASKEILLKLNGRLNKIRKKVSSK